MKSNYKKLGSYIREMDTRNSDGRLCEDNLYGISVTKEFIVSHANLVGVSFENYKVVGPRQFAYIPDTSRRGDKIAISFNRFGEQIIVSSICSVFEIIDEEQLLPEYLMLWFMRPEFDRYARFMSNGSAREVFDWECLCGVELPVPSIEEQHRIAKAYQVVTDRVSLLKHINATIETVASCLYQKTISSSSEAVSIASIGEFVRGKNITSDEMCPGEYDVISAGTSPSGKHDAYNVKAPSITISGSGVNAGFVSYHFKDIWAADCSYNNSSKGMVFLYFSLRYLEEKIKVLKDGNSAQPHVYAKDINALYTPMVSPQELFVFEEKAKPLFNQISINLCEIKCLESVCNSIILNL